VLVVVAAMFIEQKLKIDDPVGAVAVHCVNGAWGILALGLFSNGSYGEGLNGVEGPVRGLFFGDSGQFVAECIGIVANLAYVGVMSGLAFYVIGKIVGNRVSAEDEMAGLDVPEMGIEGYAREAGHTSALPEAATKAPSLVPSGIPEIAGT
jgi:ammonium transporter, Amt family